MPTTSRAPTRELAFVTTNSVSQGEHVGLMFPVIFAKGIEIGFAYTSFRWENNAKRNAGVTVRRHRAPRRLGRVDKYIYTDGLQIAATNINGYLADGPTSSIERREAPLGRATRRWSSGSMPTDGGASDPDARQSGSDLIDDDPRSRARSSSATWAPLSSSTAASATACGS